MTEDERPSFDSEVVAREKNLWVVGLGSLPVVAAGALLIGMALRGLSPDDVAGPVVPLLLLGGLTLGLTLSRNYVPVSTQRRVRVEPDVLVVGTRRIARKAIRDAQMIPEPRDAGYFVRIKALGRSPIELVVKSHEEGLELLRALGFGASQRVAGFWTMSSARGYFVERRGTGVALTAAAMFLAVVFGRYVFVAPAFATLAVLAILTMAIPTRVEVGADGVSIRWLWHRVFLPHGQIVGLAVSQRRVWNQRYAGVALTLAGGRELWVPTARRGRATEQAGALIERIREAQELKGGADAVATAAFLDRGSRAVGEWMARLRALGAGEMADLRTAPLGPEQLWRVLESRSAAPSARAAAAVALGPTLDQGGKARLRVARDTVADTRLRVVLDAATAGDEEALEEALSDIAATGAEKKSSTDSP